MIGKFVISRPDSWSVKLPTCGDHEDDELGVKDMGEQLEAMELVIIGGGIDTL
jgi:hypothetical protein